jgi:hypothetical protein
MLRHCIIAGGTILSACLFVYVMSAGGAIAQTADSNAGRPLQLLQNMNPAKAGTRTKITAAAPSRKTKMAGKNHFRPHVRIAAKRHHVTTQMAQAAAPENTPPIAPSAPIADAVPMPSPTLEPLPSAIPSPGELVVGGQEVRVASPDDVNEIDLAANSVAASSSPPAAGTRPATSAVEATPKTDAVSVGVARQASDSQEPSPVGSTSWIMQVLAALGGAVAAGSVAWFLIGSGPQRTYG